MPRRNPKRTQVRSPANGHPRFGGRGMRTNSKVTRGGKPVDPATAGRPAQAGEEGERVVMESGCVIRSNVKRNSAGFALKKLGKGWCVVAALVLRQRLGRMIRPGFRAGLTCGDTRCEAEEHVFEERIPGARDVTKFTDSTKGTRNQKGIAGSMTGWDLEAAADEILNVPRLKPTHGYKTRNARRDFYSDRELQQKSRREIPLGDAMKNVYLDENGVTVLIPSYREDEY